MYLPRARLDRLGGMILDAKKFSGKTEDPSLLSTGGLIFIIRSKTICKSCQNHKNTSTTPDSVHRLHHCPKTCVTNSGVARISRLGGTPVTWPDGPMRVWVFGEGQRSGPRPHQLGGLGESCHYPPPPPPPKKKKILDLHEPCGHACRQ